jgi:hypothetical protein
MPRKPLQPEERIVRSKKKLAMGVREIMAAIKRGKGQDRGTAKCPVLVAPKGLVVRLIIRARHKLPESWAMSLLVNNDKVDGIDWEGLRPFKDVNGMEKLGWHRHVWNPTFRTCKAHKIHLPEFDTVTTLRGFIVEGLTLLKITPREEDAIDDGSLRLD